MTPSTHLLRPLRLSLAVVVFGLSALPFWVGIYLVLPSLARRGASTALALSAGLLIPLALLLAAAVASARRQSIGRGVAGLRGRLRVEKLRWKDAGWAAALLAVTLGGYFGLRGTAVWFQTHVGLVPPPELDLVQTGRSFWGIELAGNWWAVLLHVGILVLNVAGEELWFRGVLFPRQEAAHGTRAWLVHGLCYHGFHMFFPWDVLRLLPESIMYGWVAQRSRSTWPGILSHFVFNGLGLIATISGVLAT